MMDKKKPSLVLYLTAIGAFMLMPSLASATFAFQDTLSDDYRTDLFGFFETRAGFRTQDAAYEKDASIAEARLQLDLSSDLRWGILKFKGDMVGDLVEEEANPELREFNLVLTPLSNMDLKVGRQVLTWGTGDLLFINDLFPKDWVSFFIGRDDEYLKAPSDAVKASFFFDLVNLDLVYMPVFNNSTYIDGSRVSYWNPLLERTAGRDHLFEDEERLRFFRDSEIAMRIFKNVGSTEYALYGYNGFWSTPEGINPATGKGVYPRLSVYGASFRTTLFGGISNMEVGYYDSREDRDGNDPFIRNSEIRALAGFEKELARDFTGGCQYYVEYMQDYDNYKASQPPGAKLKDEVRHVVTLRLTKLLMNQNLKLSLFGYFSPSDKDGYLRPKVHYKITDQWAAEIGGNLFHGDEDYTFFGQFEDNTNVFAAIRWSF